MTLYIIMFLNKDDKLTYVHTMSLPIAVMFVSVYPTSAKFDITVPRELTVQEATMVVRSSWAQLILEASKKLC